MVGVECKLCFKKFSNGKALGGHMRVHYAALPLPPKTPQRQEQLSTEPLTESTSALFSFGDEGNNEKESSADQNPLLVSVYGLREKPKKSSRVVDDAGGSVVGTTDSESTGGRCKKRSVTEMSHPVDINEEVIEEEGSVFTEEDGAFCLVMLSRDAWRRSWTDSVELTRKVYKCDRCNRVFKSSQGLGSHRATHYNNKSTNINSSNEILENDEFRKKKKKMKKIDIKKEELMHECPICNKNFSSAQALGGHKRSHFLVSNFGKSLNGSEENSSIDLNLIPAGSVLEEEDEEFMNKVDEVTSAIGEMQSCRNCY